MHTSIQACKDTGQQLQEIQIPQISKLLNFRSKRCFIIFLLYILYYNYTPHLAGHIHQEVQNCCFVC